MSDKKKRGRGRPALPSRTGQAASLRNARVQSGMRVSEIATTLGITSLRWYAWEIGKSPIPARFAKKIRSLLGVSLDDLLP